ncbi:MAG: TonB-dependent receptor [Acidobacteriota bacterium]
MTSILLFLSFFADVRGVVTDPAGQLVENAKVTCGTASATTDASGKFVLTGAQDCTGSVIKEGFAKASVLLKASDAKGPAENRVALTVATLTERVVVSATGTPVALEEAGISGDVFTEKDLEVRQYAPVSDLLRDVAGLNVTQAGSNGGVISVFPRGGNSNTTLVMLDGIPLTDPGGAMNFANLSGAGLSRVESVRGPEGSLYGAEASSGVVQLFSKQGDAEARMPHGSLSYERGSFSTDHWIAGLGGGALGNRLDYYATVDQNRSTGPFPNNVYRIITGTANVGYRISNSTSVRATTRNYDAISGTPGLTFYKAFNLDGLGHDRDHALNVKVEDVRSAHFSQRAYYTYHQLRSINTDPKTESYVVAALTTSALPLRAGTPAVVYLNQLVPVGTAGAVQRTITVFGGGFQSFTDRSSFGYQGTVTHKYGSFLFGYENERQGGEFLPVTVKRRNNGFSAFEQLKIGKRIFMSGGTRVEHSNIYGSRLAPRGSITFLLPTNTYLRMSLARGIQEPSMLQTNSPNPGFPGNATLKPEKTDTFEAGLTRTWMGGRLRSEFAYFRNLFTDLIQFKTIDPVTFVGSWFNVDKAYSRGYEASGSFRIVDGVQLKGSYTHLYTRWITGSELGQQLSRRPPNQGAISLQVAPEKAKWNFLIGARFVGERRDTFNTFGINRSAGYQYVFLDGAYQIHKNVALFARVNNLSNESYQEVTGYAQWGRNASGGLRMSW